MASKNIITDLGIKELISKIKTSLSTKSDTSHTHNIATTSSNGFLSSSDKSKLDNMVKATVEVKLPVSGWTSTSPYTLTISCSLVTSDMTPDLYISYPDDISSETIDTYNESFNAINQWETGNGIITCTCYGDKPTVDVYALLKIGIVDLLSSVEDNLISKSSVNALSANMGRVLNESIEEFKLDLAEMLITNKYITGLSVDNSSGDYLLVDTDIPLLVDSIVDTRTFEQSADDLIDDIFRISKTW